MIKLEWLEEKNKYCNKLVNINDKIGIVWVAHWYHFGLADPEICKKKQLIDSKTTYLKYIL